MYLISLIEKTCGTVMPVCIQLIRKPENSPSYVRGNSISASITTLARRRLWSFKCLWTQPQWKEKVTPALQSLTPLDLEDLRNLLAPSTRIHGPFPELHDLQKRVDEGDRWRRKATYYVEAHWKTLHRANEQVRRHLGRKVGRPGSSYL